MKKNIIFIFIVIFLIFISYIGVSLIEKKIFSGINNRDSDIVTIKYFTKSDCIECTKIDNYLEVYKKAGVKFGNISKKEYLGGEYRAHIKEYEIDKLPFVVFSKELSKYDTISNSWDNTFGYKNEKGEFISTDIIPPYFDIESREVKGLIDIIYIGKDICLDCYSLNDAKDILSTFGLQFSNINKLDNKSEKAINIIKKYNIDVLPVIILSNNTSLYKNFSYFWQTIGSIENDGKYILRNPENIGLK